MQLSTIIQSCLDLYANPSYLEIGVTDHDAFRQFEAGRKVAVDPEFSFPAIPTATIKGSSEYHEMHSDQYFGSVAKRSDVFDVIFIDGFHTFEQTLRDLLNATTHLGSDGVIIIDDVIPSSYNASLASLTEAFKVRDFLSESNPDLANDGSWMGDVFKIPFFVDTFMQAFSYATVAEGSGQMIMWRQTRESTEDRLADTITRLQFKDTITGRAIYRLRPLAEIVASVRAAGTM